MNNQPSTLGILPPERERNAELALKYLRNHRGDALERLFALLRIPSISARPEHNADVERAAEFLSACLSEIGFTATIHPTAGKPMVIARNFEHDPSQQRRTGDEDQVPHIIFYGHYDVQPAEPIEEWDSDPFEPQLAGSGEARRIVARGACDDKGQMMTFCEAFRAWHATHGAIPLRITVLAEGEEEIGSLSMEDALKQHAGELANADCVMVCDTEMWDQRTPAITTRLRGLLYEEIELSAANRDLHSGLFGGLARNAGNLLTHILGKLHDDNGRVTIDGFYDDVQMPSAAVTKRWQEANFDWQSVLADIGLRLPAGETDKAPIEQLWARPTADVNGFICGYTGVGSKTVIPAKASAKVSFRLVSGQDPTKIQNAFRAWIRKQVPDDCSVTFANHARAAAITVPDSNPYVAAAQQALTEQWNTPPVIAGCGASIPIVELFARVLGIDGVLVGFALPANGMHAPNENYTLASFHGASESWVRIIDALANTARQHCSL